jgi:type 1 glutamine amidotransferase
MAIPILLISQGIFHPSLLCRYWLKQGLDAARRFEIYTAPSIEFLRALDTGPFQADEPYRAPTPYKAIVLYFHRKTISAEALDRLDGYIRQGGGCLAIHSASASFKMEPRYFEILGGRFSRHGPVGAFAVQPVDPGGIFSQTGPFTLRDEAYLHDFGSAAPHQNTVHFAAEINGQREPLVWTRQHGAGRVCTIAAGHTAASLRHPTIQKILIEGLQWAAGCNVT